MESALRNKCHDNARSYAERHPGCAVVHGWLAYLQGCGEPIGATFEAHSVVALADGRLIDVTPLDYASRFLRHPEGLPPFEALMRAHVNQINFVAGLST